MSPPMAVLGFFGDYWNIYRMARPYRSQRPKLVGTLTISMKLIVQVPLVLDRNIQSGPHCKKDWTAESGGYSVEVNRFKGTDHNPWEDKFDEERGIIHYSGDNKTQKRIQKCSRESGTFTTIPLCPLKKDFDSSAPIVCFERVKVGTV